MDRTRCLSLQYAFVPLTHNSLAKNLLSQFFHVPINISLPDSAFNDDANTGTYSFQLTLPVTQEFLLTMSDATGFASGGTSDVLTVGSSVSGASCNTAGAKPAFTFELNSALQQCE